MMNNANSMTGVADPRPAAGSLRITDVGRLLWVLTTVVLVLGYAALQALSGAGNAPQIEKVAPTQPQASAPASDEPDQQPVHTLHPMTASEVVPTVAPQRYETHVGRREYAERQTWLEVPEEDPGHSVPQR